MRELILGAALLLAVAIPHTRTADAVAVVPPAKKRIALSFDDVPRGIGAFFTADERGRRLIAGLQAAQVRQVALFVNPARINLGDGDEARIARYVAAGAVIANHTFSHPHLSSSGADAYLSDIDRAQQWLKGRPGYRPWFRFPFLDEGGRDTAKRDAVREGLDARGLRNGYVTVDGSDWNMEALTIAARREGRVIDMTALKTLYIETMVRSADFSDDLMTRTLGRSPPHVLLLHETDLAALYIRDLVEALRADGWEIVTADDAYADPVGLVPPDVAFANGTLAEELAWEKGVPAPRWYERNDTKIADALFRTRVLHEKAP